MTKDAITEGTTADTHAPFRAAGPRVLELVTLSDWGGAQGHVLAVARHLKARYDMTVACAPGGPLIDSLHREGVRVVEIPSLVRAPNPLADITALWRLVAFMRQERFNIVHCHSTKAGFLGRVAARLAGVPGTVFTAHGWPFTAGWSPAVRIASTLAERAVARLSTAIICVSEHTRREALRLRIGRPEQLHVIYNGVDPGRWAPALSRGNRPAGEGHLTVMVARLQAPKDPVTLIEAWARVSRPHRLVLIGDGPLRPRLDALIATRGLADRVSLLGARDDVPRVLAQADVFVLSTRWEGFPLVIIEAMMCGLPVIATDVGGIAEAVEHQRTGMLVPPGRPDALADALNQMLNDGALRRINGEAGRQRALEQFTEARMVEQIDRVYTRALDGATRPAVRTAG
jgi:glycosyltransferase involved in cell wall biosynthesis